MKVLIWTDVFPTYSETFIRDHIIGLIDEKCDVLIHSNIKGNLDVLKDFSDYNFENRIFTNKNYLPEQRTLRLLKAVIILITSIFSKNFNYYLKTLNFFLYNKKAISFRYFYLLHFIIKHDIKIIHAHFGTNARQLIFFKEINYPIKLVTTFHGYDIRIQKDYAKKFYKKLFLNIDHVVSISTYNKKELLSFGLNPNKIVSINNGVLFPDTKSSFVFNSNKVIEILSIGRLVEDKNYKLALITLSRFKSEYPEKKFQYHIIGEGELKKQLQKLVVNLNLEHNVIFYGYKNSTFVRQMLAKTHFLMLSSKHEAIPTVILEAQSYGLPVLATNVGAIKDIVNKNNGVLSELSETDFYNSFLKLINLRFKWLKLGENGRNQIRKSYSQKHQISKLLALYKS